MKSGKNYSIESYHSTKCLSINMYKLILLCCIKYKLGNKWSKQPSISIFCLYSLSILQYLEVNMLTIL
jgi:hypothetical protein